jgi:hypothetical protein
VQTFAFRFAGPYRWLALPFGVTPRTARVAVEDEDLYARFGPWSVRTPLSNVTDVRVTGPYSLPKTAGPAHLSLKDHGLTFATNGERGVCVLFREPVKGLDPTGRLTHPGLTLTVDDVDGLAALLRTRAGVG